ncbi:TKL protein kinase [Saprolegnia diclina VS20]|uniref:TKL protein kinase n=1 Tax=Saprolegnia diclina (strain VS20) TaxID=1156394 RepID=T0R1T5_SAPDV|nr:TKL protein kinase [Saprolegnia diclina VS20]EQC25948.1 TKL protein kinase [Saprolegnia diclina VS20]|eukprot:XP_008620628.1 TKL protein kinase [Saprolegnia diclina VS20]
MSDTLHQRLFYAAFHGDISDVKAALRLGADVDRTNETGATALYVAAENGHESVVEQLVTARAAIDARNDHGWTPLLIAVRRQHTNIVCRLVKAGADINAADHNSKCTPAYVASTYGFVEILRLLVQEKANVNTPQANGYTPLLAAAKLGHTEVLQLLIDAGADLTATSSSHKSARDVAVQNGYAAIVDLLDQATNLALTKLAAASSTKAISRQLQQGINSTNEEGQSVLHLAVAENNAALVQHLLLLPGVDAKKKNKANETPLLLAIKRMHRRIAAHIYAFVHRNEIAVELSAADLVEHNAEHLGSGATGDVYKATYQGTTVAVKHFCNGYKPNEVFRRELCATQLCKSPYTVQLLGILNHETPKLVLEFMDMGDLSAYLRCKRAGTPTLATISNLAILWAIVNALADMHDKGIMHRDLKSRNVFLSSTGYVKVGDFGLTREFEPNMTTHAGTPYWMAPEVFVSGASYDFSADIYAFGVIMTELDKLQDPFTTQNESSYVIANKGTKFLCVAAEEGLLDDIERLLQAGTDINQCHDGTTPLCAAAANGHTAVVEALLVADANPFQCNEEDIKPRDIARANGHASVVGVLDKAMANLVQLVTALSTKDDASTLRLLQANVPVTISYSSTEWQVALPMTWTDPVTEEDVLTDGFTPLHIAAIVGVTEIVALLLARPRIVIDAVDNAKQTPLHLAAMFNHEGVVSLLLTANANVNASSKRLYTPLHLAAEYGHGGVVSVLLAVNADVNAQTKDQETALFLAAKEGHVDVVTRLLAAHADPSMSSHNIESPYMAAQAKGHNEIMAMLNEALNSRSRDDETTNTTMLISDAVLTGKADYVANLLRSGVDPNTRYEPTAGVGVSFLLAKAKARINDGSYFLHVAAADDSRDIVQLLLDQPRIEVDALDCMRSTPLYVAAAHGHVTVVQQLLRANADVALATETLQTPVHAAVTAGHHSVVQVLLDAGASLDCKTIDNKTPLTLAIELENEEILAIFRARMSAKEATDASDTAVDGFFNDDDYDVPDPAQPVPSVVCDRVFDVEDSDTINEQLIQSVVSGDVQRLQSLLRANANPNTIQAETGDSLLHIAIRHEQDSIVDVLLQSRAIDLQQRNAMTETALVVAIKQHHVHMAQKLFYAMSTTHYVTADEIEIDRSVALGDGKGCIVYKGAFKDQLVAVKTAIYPSHAQGLRNEIAALQRCGSPYLMRLLAVADQNTPAPNLVLELMNVGNLRMYLDKKRDGLDTEVDNSLLDVAWVVANGLADLHRQGLRHRDLKSSNILLSTTNYIQVSGLGLAFKQPTAPSSPPHTGGGMPFWTAPEMLRKGQIYSDKADVYSFGVILIELETLQLPYATQDIDDCTFRGDVRDGKLQPSISSTCAPWLRDLISRCLAYNPSQRPSAQEIVDLLQELRLATCDRQLLSATLDNRMADVAYLLGAGVSPRSQSWQHATPLFPAATLGHAAIAQRPVLADADVDQTPLASLPSTTFLSLPHTERDWTASAHDDGPTPLFVAAQNGHLDVVEVLVCTGKASVDVAFEGETPLFTAAKHGHAHIIERLLLAGADVHHANNDGLSILHVAAANGHDSVVMSLLAAGANLVQSAQTGDTPLHAAVVEGHTTVVQLLLKAGAAVDTQNEAGATPLAVASSLGHPSIVQQLLDARARIDLSDKTSATPLYLAVEHSHLEVVRRLVDAYANVNESNESWWTPLHVAAQHGRTQLVQLLLAAGADVELTNGTYATALYLAARNGHIDAVALLLDAGANVDTANGDNRTPLYAAAVWDHPSVVALLLSAGANVNLRNRGNCSPLDVACTKGHTEVARLLLEHPDMNVNDRPDSDNETNLMVAAEAGYTRIVSMLLAAHADVDAVDDDDATPLYVAVEKRHEAIVDLLLVSGADTNVKRRNSTTTLYCAAQLGLLSVVHKLVVAGANIAYVASNNATARLTALVHEHYEVVAALDHARRCQLGKMSSEQQLAKQVPALHRAVSRGQTARIASMLEEESSAVHARDGFDQTALHVAALVNRAKIAEELLHAGARLCQDLDGNTPLHLAATFGQGSVVELLLTKAPDAVDVANKDGLTAMAIAARNGHTDIVERLLQHKQP